MPTTTSSTKRRPIRAVTMTIAVGAVAGLSLTACSSSGSAGSGSGGKSPTEALAAAVRNVSSGNAESFQLTVKPDDAMVAAITKQSDNSQDAQSAKALFGNGGIVVKFTASASKPLKDLKAGENPNIELDLTAGGTDFFDIRTVSGALYAKVNAPQLLQLSGKSASSVTGQLSQAPADFQAPLQALMAGKWIGVSASDFKGLEQMLQNFGGAGDLASGPTSSSSGSAGTQMLAGIESQLMKALTQDATVTDKGNGQYQVSGKVKTIGQDVLQAVTPVLNAVPGKSKTDIDKLRQNLNSVPDSENMTFDIWTKNGQISELQVDLAQFMSAAETNGGHLPIDAKFSQSASTVSAPSDVTTVNVQKLLGAFGGGL